MSSMRQKINTSIFVSSLWTIHANECGNSAACYLSISNRLILIVLGQLGAFWGHLYLDANGHEIDDLTSSVPLYLSEQRFHKLIEDWTLQSFQIVFRDLIELILYIY
uniref:E3 ubiquitin-protein ligase n=1 Tax=Wuchereria bancrofti TaxID=6293 RepID=A0A1I8EMZ4_WUCBA